MSEPERENPYSVLGIKASASQEEIKLAFRELARRFHPDRNPGDREAEEQFRRAQAAYELLSDPEARREYDRERKPRANRRGLIDAHKIDFQEKAQGAGLRAILDALLGPRN